MTQITLPHRPALLERPNAGVLTLHDADRADFLQRMTTNNIAALRPGLAAVTVLTSPTARIVQVFTVLCRADDLLLLPAPGEAAALERHLRGQIFFMDKVRVANRSADFARMRLVGDGAAALLQQALGFRPPGDDTWVEQEGVMALAQARYDLPGIEILAPLAAAADVRAALAAAGARRLTAESAEEQRILLGRPAAGAELTPDFNPLEAGLAWACAENKGCYTGQEIISRQVTYDKVTRTLVGLFSGAPLAVGAPLLADGREVGVVTSATAPADGTPLALAIVKRPHNQPGAQLQAGGVTATVAALPFSLPGAD